MSNIGFFTDEKEDFWITGLSPKDVWESERNYYGYQACSFYWGFLKSV